MHDRKGRRRRRVIHAAVLLAALAACAPVWAKPQVKPDAQEESQKREKPRLRDWLVRGGDTEGEENGHARGFFPLFGTVVSGSGAALGAGYRDYRVLGTPLGFEVSGLVSVRGYQLYRAHFGMLGPHRRTLDLRPADTGLGSMVDDGTRNRKGYSIYLDARYRSYPQHRFYGSGPDSRHDDRSDYLLKGAAYDVVLQAQASRAFGVSVRAGILQSQIGEGHDDNWPATQDRFAPAQAPGLAQPPQYFVSGVGAAFDKRDNPRDPRSGTFLAAAAWRFDARQGRPFDFTRLALDARTYLKPLHTPGVIALRGIVSTDLAAVGAQVPFFLQQSLGGGELLRSWDATRWRDRSVAHATVEYRWHVHPMAEVTPFVDVGTVGPRLDALRWNGVRTSVGIAVRPHWDKRVLGRMELAWGRGGARLVFATGPIF